MPEHIKKQLLEEIKALEHELTPELPAEIKKAGALGDFRRTPSITWPSSGRTL